MHDGANSISSKTFKFKYRDEIMISNMDFNILYKIILILKEEHMTFFINLIFKFLELEFIFLYLFIKNKYRSLSNI